MPGATPRAGARAWVPGQTAATIDQRADRPGDLGARAVGRVTGRGREGDSHDPARVRRGTAADRRERAADQCGTAAGPVAGPAVRHERVARRGTPVGRHGPVAVHRGMADADRGSDPTVRTSEADAHHPCMAADLGRGEGREARQIALGNQVAPIDESQNRGVVLFEHDLPATIVREVNSG